MFFKFFNLQLNINSSFTLNCKQAVITNVDWIQPELNKDYAEWAEHNHTAIVPAKVRKPKYYRRKSIIGNLSLNALYTPIMEYLPQHFC